MASKTTRALTLQLEPDEQLHIDELMKYYGVRSREAAVKKAIRQSLFNLRAIFEESPELMFERKKLNRESQRHYDPDSDKRI